MKHLNKFKIEGGGGCHFIYINYIYLYIASDLSRVIEHASDEIQLVFNYKYIPKEGTSGVHGTYFCSFHILLFLREN